MPNLSTMASPNTKMNVLKTMIAVHKAKQLSRTSSLAVPFWKVFKKHPITRGMASYLVIWPTGNIIQQIITGQEKIDWWRVIRFGIYGCLITAPSLYAWVRLSTAMYPNTNLRVAMAKVRYIRFLLASQFELICNNLQALIETISYTPFAIATLFYSMTWLETFSAAEAFAEVQVKFLPTYCAAITVWPLIGVSCCFHLP